MYQRTEPTSSSIFYRKTGQGPAVVLLHGFPESGTLWKGIEQTLSQSATLLIPDMPGAGNSPLEGDMSMADIADKVKEMLDAEQIDRAVLAGHSMGGYVALAFADRYPGAVAGISLVHSTPVADDEEKKTMRRKSIELINRGGKRVFITQMIPNLFSEDFKTRHPVIVQNCVDEAMKMSEDGMINFYRAMIDRKDTTDILNKAKYPLQWIMGYNDNIIPYKKNIEHCYRSAINFVSLYENCGHMSMYEAPAKLIRDLKHFIDYCYTRHNEV